MSRIVDLTVTIGPETLSPPSVNKRLTLTSNYRGPGYWRASSVDMVLHTGSHVDFSLHVIEGGETAADVALDRFCGEALVLDLSYLGPDEPITAEAVAERAGELRPGDITGDGLLLSRVSYLVSEIESCGTKCARRLA
jgi:kynurenine formamidase